MSEVGEVGQRPDSGWKRRVLKWVGIGAATATAVGGVAYSVNKIENAVHDPDFGQPVANSQPFEASLIHSTNQRQEDIPPVFRSNPSDTSDELTPEQLQEKGLDPNATNVKVMEVYGQTYASDTAPGFIHNDQTRKNHGIWGEIVVTDPDTGQDKPTGIYLSENFISKNEPAPSAE